MALESAAGREIGWTESRHYNHSDTDHNVSSVQKPLALCSFSEVARKHKLFLCLVMRLIQPHDSRPFA